MNQTDEPSRVLERIREIASGIEKLRSKDNAARYAAGVALSNETEGISSRPDHLGPSSKHASEYNRIEEKIDVLKEQKTEMVEKWENLTGDDFSEKHLESSGEENS